MHCRNCGTEVNLKAIACPSCGLGPLSENKFCQECGAPTHPNQIVCIKCGVQLITKRSVSPAIGNLNLNTDAFSGGFDQIRSGSYNVPGLIVSSLMLVSLFLPWYTAGSRGYWYSTHTSENAFSSTYGILAFIFTAASIVLSFMNFRWTFVAGGMCFLFSLVFLLNSQDSGYRGFWYFSHAGPAFGLYFFMILSVVYTVLNIKTYRTG